MRKTFLTKRELHKVLEIISNFIMKTLLVNFLKEIKIKAGAEAPSSASKNSWFGARAPKSLQRKIMRGIYYAYMLRLVSLPGVLQGFVMLGILIVLTRFVSLANVIQNLSNIEMSDFGTFAYNAVRTTELWTLLLIGMFVFLLLSLRISLVPKQESQYSFSHI